MLNFSKVHHRYLFPVLNWGSKHCRRVCKYKVRSKFGPKPNQPNAKHLIKKPLVFWTLYSCQGYNGRKSFVSFSLTLGWTISSGAQGWLYMVLGGPYMVLMIEPILMCEQISAFYTISSPPKIGSIFNSIANHHGWCNSRLEKSTDILIKLNPETLTWIWDLRGITKVPHIPTCFLLG